MSRLADPTICPDCRAALDQGGHCRGCGLRLQGPVAAELWRTMQDADRLVGRLRQQAPVAASAPPAASVTPGTPAPAPSPGPAPAPAAGPLPAYPSAPPAGPQAVPPAPERRRGLAAASVPVVLLSLGGLCLVVFAAIFLGVAWDVLGLAGRSLVVLLITAVLAGSAALVTRRGLRASAETLWLVVGLVLTLDLYAASAADLVVTGLSGRATTTVVGVALLLVGAAVAAWSRRCRTGLLVAPQLLTVLGVAALAVAQTLTRDDPAPASAVLVGLLLAAGWGLARLRLPWAAVGTLGVALLFWALLVTLGALEGSTLVGDDSSLWWLWLLVGSAYAALVALAPRALLAPLEGGRVAVLRAGAAAAVLVPLLLLLTAERVTTSPTGGALLAALGQVVLVVLVVVAPLAWARGASPLAVLGALGIGGSLLGQTVTGVAAVVLDGRADVAPDERLAMAGDLHPLAWLVLALVLAGSVAGLLGLSGPGLAGALGGRSPSREAATEVTLASGVSALALGGWAAVLATGPLLWAAVLAGVLATAATGWATWWFGHRRSAALVAGLATAWLGGTVAWLALVSGSALLLALVLTVLAVPVTAAGVTRDRAGSAYVAAVLLGLGALLGAGAVHQWADWLGAEGLVLGLVLSAYAAALLLGARPATRHLPGRVTLELVAAPVALAALVVTEDASGSLVLTVLGVALAVSAVWQRDRAPLAWMALAIGLVAVAWRGLAGLDVPELASLPVAAVLLAGGLARLRADADAPSVPTLGPGLGLAVVPSLLLALGDPVSLRGAVVAVVAVGLLVVGVLRRLSAPFVVGAVATALLVLRHLGPVADAVPRWMAIGVVGAALLVAGITWEAGLRNLARARHYVTSLR